MTSDSKSSAKNWLVKISRDSWVNAQDDLHRSIQGRFSSEVIENYLQNSETAKSAMDLAESL